MKTAMRIAAFLICLSVLALTACSGRFQGSSTPPLPAVTFAVAPCSQPLVLNELLAGNIPEVQEKISTAELQNLDTAFDALLHRETSRAFVSSFRVQPVYELALRDSDQNKHNPIEFWAGIGKKVDVEYLLIPVILNWHERTGGDSSAFSPASVTLDLLLMDVKNKELVSRYHFDETQETLSDNLLEFGKYLERKGQWINATPLALEGLNQGIKELGL